MRRVPSCVWRLTPGLLVALERHFDQPTDSYVNGSQVWLLDNGPNGATLEWRLHPVAGFQRPAGTTTFDLFEQVIWALTTGEEPPAPPETLWEGLEAFPVDDLEIEPAPLAAAVTEALGIAPDAFGLVDHTSIGDRWEASGGRVSIVSALLDQLA